MLKPTTWKPRNVRRSVTISALVLTATWITLLVLSFGYDSSPPVFTANSILVALAWIARLEIWRNDAGLAAGLAADETLLKRITQSRPASASDAEFEEITQHLKELREQNGLNT